MYEGAFTSGETAHEHDCILFTFLTVLFRFGQVCKIVKGDSDILIPASPEVKASSYEKVSFPAPSLAVSPLAHFPAEAILLTFGANYHTSSEKRPPRSRLIDKHGTGSLRHAAALGVQTAALTVISTSA